MYIEILSKATLAAWLPRRWIVVQVEGRSQILAARLPRSQVLLCQYVHTYMVDPQRSDHDEDE